MQTLAAAGMPVPAANCCKQPASRLATGAELLLLPLQLQFTAAAAAAGCRQLQLATSSYHCCSHLHQQRMLLSLAAEEEAKQVAKESPTTETRFQQQYCEEAPPPPLILLCAEILQSYCILGSKWRLKFKFASPCIKSTKHVGFRTPFESLNSGTA